MSFNAIIGPYIIPISFETVKSDSMELSTEEILVTFENSISVMHSSVTELECQSDSLSKVIKETAGMNIYTYHSGRRKRFYSTVVNVLLSTNSILNSG